MVQEHQQLIALPKFSRFSLVHRESYQQERVIAPRHQKSE
jgi:hypothetical protein